MHCQEHSSAQTKRGRAAPRHLLSSPHGGLPGEKGAHQKAPPCPPNVCEARRCPQDLSTERPPGGLATQGPPLKALCSSQPRACLQSVRCEPQILGHLQTLLYSSTRGQRVPVPPEPASRGPAAHSLPGTCHPSPGWAICGWLTLLLGVLAIMPTHPGILGSQLWLRHQGAGPPTDDLRHSGKSPGPVSYSYLKEEPRGRSPH